MAQQLAIKGFLLPNAGCSDGCAGISPSSCPWELTFRNCLESYQQVRQGDLTLATSPGVFVDLFALGTFTQIELLALKTQGPITLRVNGEPAEAVTAALFPVAGLNGQTLLFSVDGLAVSVLFVTGDDTALEIAARINAAAALAGSIFMPASVVGGQIVIAGRKTGPQGTLSAFTGTAADDLGLDGWLPQTGTGADIPVDGLMLTQFGRNPNGASRVEASGAAALSVLAAGV